MYARSMIRRPALVITVLLVAACGGSSKKPAEPAAAEADAGGEKQTTALVVEGAAASHEEAPDAESAEQVYQRVQADLVACYEQGKKAAPKMLSGRATLDVSIDSSGKA